MFRDKRIDKIITHIMQCPTYRTHFCIKPCVWVLGSPVCFHFVAQMPLYTTVWGRCWYILTTSAGMFWDNIAKCFVKPAHLCSIQNTILKLSKYPHTFSLLVRGVYFAPICFSLSLNFYLLIFSRCFKTLQQLIMVPCVSPQVQNHFASCQSTANMIK